jgi:F-type H+-transporting ATPase subunit delta
MSFAKKIAKSYSSSLFQNVNNSKSSEENEKSFKIGNLIVIGSGKKVPTVFVIGEELAIIRSMFLSSAKIKKFFDDPSYEDKQKVAILLNLFPGMTQILKSFLKVLSEKSHLGLLPEISEEYTELLLKFKKVTSIKLIVATILQEHYGLSLLKTLKSISSSEEILLNVSYNPKILGGLILEYKSISIDASLLKEFHLLFNDI